MELNEPGHMVARWWKELERKFPTAEIDEYVVMPNHFHGIVFLNLNMDVGATLRGRPDPGQPHRTAPTCENGCLDSDPGQPHRAAPTLGEIIDWFKTMTTNEYIRGVRERGWLSFQKHLWQRNYYERVIRDEDELNQARNYIHDNPLMWHLDRENPDATGSLPGAEIWEAVDAQ